MMEITIKNVTLMEETVVYPMWKKHIALIVNVTINMQLGADKG